MKRVFAFDFDGTITTKDTLFAFIRYAKGSFALYFGLFIFSPLLILMRLHAYSGGKVKQRLLTYFFKGMTIEHFDNICERFAKDNKQLLRPAAIAKMEEAIGDGITVLIVSASIENWVRPFFNGLPIVFLCTEIEVEEGRLTGKFATPNCYGAEKVRRIEAIELNLLTSVHCYEAEEASRFEEAFPNIYGYELTAFGDSRGDKEMIEYADKGYYKPFR